MVVKAWLSYLRYDGLFLCWAQNYIELCRNRYVGPVEDTQMLGEFCKELLPYPYVIRFSHMGAYGMLLL